MTSPFGLPSVTWRGELISDLAYNAVLDTVEQLPRARKRDPDSVVEAVTRAVRAAVATAWGKKPLCRVHVLMV